MTRADAVVPEPARCVPGHTATGTTSPPRPSRRRGRARRRAASSPLDVPQVVVPDARGAMAPPPTRFFGDPTAAARAWSGVTGTNGKTTTAFLVALDPRGGGPPGRPARHRRAARRAAAVEPVRADDARGRRPAGARSAACSDAGDRACGDGGVVARARLRARRRRALRRRGVHQPHAGPPRLPRRHGGVLRGQGAALRRARCRRAAINVDDPLRPPRSPARRAPRHAASARPGRPTCAPRDVELGAGRRRSPLATPAGARATSTCRCSARFNVATCSPPRRRAARSGVAARRGGRAGSRRCRGVPGRLEPVDAGQPLHGAGRLRPHAGRARARARSAARRSTRGRLIVRVRLRRRPRPRQAPADGRGRRGAAPTRGRHLRQPAHRGPARDRRRDPGRHRRPRVDGRARPARGDRSWRSPSADAGRRRGHRRQGPRAGAGARRRHDAVRRPRRRPGAARATDRHRPRERCPAHGSCRGDAATPIRGVAIDSRAVRPGDLFVAIRGGRRPSPAPRARRARRPCCSTRPPRPTSPASCWPPPTRSPRSPPSAPRNAAAAAGASSSASPARRARRRPRTSWPRCSRRRAGHRRRGRDHNNEIGLPLTLCGIGCDTEVGVCEMAMRGARPDRRRSPPSRARRRRRDHTSAPAHLELLGSREAIAAAKGEMLAALPDDGLAVVPAGEPLLEPHLAGRRWPRRDLRRGRRRRRPPGRDRRRQGGDRPPRSNPDRAVSFDQRHNGVEPRTAVAACDALGVASTCALLARRRGWPRSRAGAASAPLAGGGVLIRLLQRQPGVDARRAARPGRRPPAAADGRRARRHGGARRGAPGLARRGRARGRRSRRRRADRGRPAQPRLRRNRGSDRSTRRSPPSAGGDPPRRRGAGQGEPVDGARGRRGGGDAREAGPGRRRGGDPPRILAGPAFIALLRRTSSASRSARRGRRGTRPSRARRRWAGSCSSRHADPVRRLHERHDAAGWRVAGAMVACAAIGFVDD